MMNCNHRTAPSLFFACVIAVTAAMLVFAGCGDSGQQQSQQEITTQTEMNTSINARTRDDMPETGITSNLEPGKAVNKDDLPAVEITSGVSAKMYWGKGNLVAWVTLEPGAAISEETLPAERLMVVWDGQVDQLIDGTPVTMKGYVHNAGLTSAPHKDFVYLPKGAKSSVKAGPDGATILELYCPVRADYIEKAGRDAPASIKTGSYNVTPNFPAGKVMNLHDLQFTSFGADRTANSRIVWGEGFQASFLSVDENRVSNAHNHPEEQLMLVLGGSVDQTIDDVTTTLTEGDIVYLPTNMVHQATYGNLGAEIIDIFWPPRVDFVEKTKVSYDKFHEFIPEGENPVLVHDGETKEPKLRFTEGPSWMNGELFFSNMWFDDGFAGGSPAKSNLIRMNRDGSLTVISSGMQTNGTMPSGNGTLIVCDMFGHRVLEMDREGNILDVIADKLVDGTRIDGPNDLVIDAKGGMYITDPQFLPGVDKVQAGKQVYYRKPDGDLIVVAEPGEMGQANGVLLSPDGKNIYFSNTRNQPFGYWQIKGDVNPDGTISNLRKWAKPHIPPFARQQDPDSKIWYSGADGMTMDTEGNVYIATRMGLQIFTPDGEYVGIVNTEVPPISCVFGGPDNDTIYMTCATQIWKIKTNKKGITYPLK